MKILIAGASGAVGTLLVDHLLKAGYEVIALTRNRHKILPRKNLTIIQADLTKAETLRQIPTDIDYAYYLVHSMCTDEKTFEHLERLSAENFVCALSSPHVKQLIFLSGIANELDLSHHINARLSVEYIFRKSQIPTTILRSAIIIGEGSSSFEIIRDLVEKLPIMTPPRWVDNLCQPIDIDDVIHYLVEIIGKESSYNRTFDIGGTDILSYKEMLLQYAKVRELKRLVITVPLLTPYLSSLWLVFITKVNFTLCRLLADSMTNNFICRDDLIDTIVPHQTLSYTQSLQKVFKVSSTPPSQSVDTFNISSSIKHPLQSTNYFGDLWINGNTVTFRPRGLLGRIYWYWLKPLHKYTLRKRTRYASLSLS